MNKKELDKAQQIKESKKRKTITIVVIALFVLLAAFAIFFSSNSLYRDFTAATINGTDMSVAEFNYYYYESYNQYKSMMDQMSSSISGDDSSGTSVESAARLKNQVMDEETGKTYGEYFVELAQSYMKETMAAYDAAMEAGYELPQEQIDSIDSSISSIDTISSYYGYSSADAYLATIYGKGMNTEIFRELSIRDAIADAYKDEVKNSYEYSTEEIETNYEENKDNYDMYNLRYFYVDGKDADGEKTEESMAEAYNRALEFQAEITDEKSFIDLSYEYASDDDKEDYESEDATLRHYVGEGLVSYYKDWLIDSSREEGDTYVAEAVNGYYVLYFISREDNQYNTRDVRLITMAVAETDESEYDSEEAYLDAKEEAKASVEEGANNLYQQWKEGDATEDSFAELAVSGSDTRSDGLNEKVNRYQLNTDVSEWLFSDSRKPGDCQVIYSESSNTYYIAYYIGENDTYAHVESDEDLREADYQNWYESLMENYPDAELKWFSKFAG